MASKSGAKNVARTAYRLGISSKLDANASIALGTSEVSLTELVGAYAPFANGGRGVAPHVVNKIRTVEGNKVLYARPADQLAQVIEPRHVAMMNTMMQETLLSGTARKAEIPGWSAAGKTGTSQDFRDAWFIGYTANLVTGVWLGNDDNSPTKKATGGGLPVEVWTRFMKTAHEGVRGGGVAGGASGRHVLESRADKLADRARHADAGERCQQARADANLGAPGSGERAGWLADGPAVRAVERALGASAISVVILRESGGPQYSRDLSD